MNRMWSNGNGEVFVSMDDGPWRPHDPHDPFAHMAEMRCEKCGKVAAGGDGTAERCNCGNVLRRFACLECGFEMMTGGPSIVDTLNAHIARTSLVHLVPEPSKG